MEAVVFEDAQGIIVGLEQLLEGRGVWLKSGPTAWTIYLALVMLKAGVMTAEPSFSGVWYLAQAAVRAAIPAFWKITPQIPPPAQRPLFAALTTASTA